MLEAEAIWMDLLQFEEFKGDQGRNRRVLDHKIEIRVCLNYSGCAKYLFGPLKVNRQTVKIQRKSRFNGHLRLKLTSKPALTHPGLVWLGLVPYWPGISRAVSPSPLSPQSELAVDSWSQKWHFDQDCDFARSLA